MKKVSHAVLAGLALLLLSIALLGLQQGTQARANEGWIFLGGPTVPGGTVVALAVAPSAPDTLYALLDGYAGRRLFRSQDAALTWQPVYTFTSAVDSVAAAPVDPTTVYTGDSDGLFRSTDGGLSWTRVYTVGAAFAVVSPTLLYAGGQVAEPDDACRTGYFGIARSDDGGTTWHMTPIGCATTLTVIEVHPDESDIIYVGGIDSTQRAPLLLRSTDGGTTWTSLLLTRLGSHAVYDLVIDPVEPDRLFASDLLGVLRSTDAGDTWERLNRPSQRLPEDPHSLAIDSDGTVYAIPSHAPHGTPIYRSDDDGETWWISTAELPRGANDLVADPLRPGPLHAGLDEYGVFQSTTGGSAWRERNTGIRSLVTVNALAVAGSSDPDLVYAGAQQPRGGLFRSHDGGLTWSTVITDTPIRAVAVNPMTPTVAYAGGNDRLYSTHDGQHWAWSFSDLRINDIAVAFQNPEWVYAGGERDRQGYIVRRTPNTTSWLGPWWAWRPVSDTLMVGAVAVHPQDPNVVFAGGQPLSSYGRVYRSRDAGDTWQEVLSDIPGDVNALVMHPYQPDIIYASTNTGVIHRSHDGGDTWERWSNLFFDGLSDFMLDVLGVPYQATGNGVYRWDAESATWIPFGLQDQWVGSLVVKPGPPQVFLAGAGAGVWRRELPLWRMHLPLVRRSVLQGTIPPTLTPTPTPTVSGPLPEKFVKMSIEQSVAAKSLPMQTTRSLNPTKPIIRGILSYPPHHPPARRLSLQRRPQPQHRHERTSHEHLR